MNCLPVVGLDMVFYRDCGFGVKWWDCYTQIGRIAPKEEARCVSQILSGRLYLKNDRIFCVKALA